MYSRYIGITDNSVLLGDGIVVVGGELERYSLTELALRVIAKSIVI